MPRLADPISIKLAKPTVRSLKERSKREEKTISQLVREMVVLSLSKTDGLRLADVDGRRRR